VIHVRDARDVRETLTLRCSASGSVATIKSKFNCCLEHGTLATLTPPAVPVIIQALAKYKDTLSIRIVLTESAAHFLGGQSPEQPTVSSLLQLPNVDAVYRDRDEWGPHPWRRGASILHIESVPCLPLSKTRADKRYS
jgi:phosphopantothenoylcysteine decarboxylase